MRIAQLRSNIKPEIIVILQYPLSHFQDLFPFLLIVFDFFLYHFIEVIADFLANILEKQGLSELNATFQRHHHFLLIHRLLNHHQVSLFGLDP